MKIEYNFSEQDFLHGMDLAIRRHPVWLNRLSGKRARIVGAELIALWLVGVFVPPVAGSFYHIWALVIGALLVGASLWTVRTWKKLYAESPSLHGPTTLEVSAAGFHCSGNGFDSQCSWSNFASYVEDKKSLILYTNTHVVIIVPKSGMSQKTIADFGSTIAQFVKKAA